MVLVNAGGNNIGTARRAVMREDECQGYTGDDAANDHRHEVLSLAHQLERQIGAFLLGNDVLCKLQDHVERQDGIDGLHQEFPSQRLERYNQQDSVNDDIGVFQMEARGIENNG